MLFKDLKSGYPIYVLDRNDVTLTQKKILEVTPPYFDNTMGITDMVVNIQIEGFNIKHTFKANEEVGYNNNSNIVITSNLDMLLKEISNIKVQAEQILSQKDTYLANIEKCKKILSEFSPTFKQEQKNNERFEKLETSVSKIEEIMTAFMKEWKGNQ